MMNYFEVGTQDSPVVSNSSMSCLNPEEGGSIINFLNFFNNNIEKKESLTLKRGRLIHKYIEKPEEFVVDESEKPTEMMAKLLDRLFINSFNFKTGIYPDAIRTVDISINSSAKAVAAKDAAIKETQVGFEKLATLLELSTDDTIRIFRFSREESYKSRLEPTLLSDITEGQNELKYLNFLKQSRDKHILTTEEKVKIDGMITSLSTHPKVSALLGLNNGDFDQAVGVTFSEVPVYWQESISPLGNPNVPAVKINCKALLDKVTVNHIRKAITIKDLKSTGSSIYLFFDSFEGYRYYRQMAFYTRALKFWFESTYPDKNYKEYTIEVFMVPIESFGSYLTTIYEVSQPWLYKGIAEARSILSRYAWHVATGEHRYSYEEHENKGILKFKNPI
jgi:hypothetical protein